MTTIGIYHKQNIKCTQQVFSKLYKFIDLTRDNPCENNTRFPLGGESVQENSNMFTISTSSASSKHVAITFKVRQLRP